MSVKFAHKRIQGRSSFIRHLDSSIRSTYSIETKKEASNEEKADNIGAAVCE